MQPDTIVPDVYDASLSALSVNFANPAFLEEVGRENRWRASQDTSRLQPLLARSEKPHGLGIVQWFQVSPASPSLDKAGVVHRHPPPNSHAQAQAIPRISIASPTTLSSVNLWIQMSQFDARIGGGEAPVYTHSFLVPFIRPCPRFPTQGSLVWDAAVQTGPHQGAQFNLCHIQPTAVLGSVVELEALS